MTANLLRVATGQASLDTWYMPPCSSLLTLCDAAQVCGLAWSPDDRSLASGGNDNQLLVWNAHSVNPVLRFTEHQVC